MKVPQATNRVPSLNALKAFESAARLGGIARAADELCVTESAVSRQIRSLEDDLGIVLFERIHRGVRLSREGQSLSATLSSAFELIRRGVDEARGPVGEIRFRTPPTFGTRWLLPRLHRFEAANTDITVRVSVLWACTLPVHADHDVAIVFSRRHWPEDDLIPLMAERLMPVCSPAFRDQFGPVESAADLARGLLLHCSGSKDWVWWSTQWNRGHLDCSRGEVFDTMDMALRAAESGRGIAIADVAMIADDLELGRLVPLVPFTSTGPDDLYLVRRDRDRPRQDIDRFVEWLMAEAGAAMATLPTGVKAIPAAVPA